MKILKILSIYVIIASILFQCAEPELIGPDASINTAKIDTQASAASKYQTGAIYFVSTAGNDGGNGSLSNPWRTLKFAVSRVPAGQGHTIKLAAGTYVENGLIEVPVGVNIEGSGKDQTILKAASTFYYYPASPAYAADKFLISLTAGVQTNGNQILKNFSIDGDGKKLHGGIYVRNRSRIMIDQVKVQNANFTGMWLWDVKDSQLTNSDIINSSWGSSSYCVGALNLGNLENVELAYLNIDESVGYGIKVIGPNNYTTLTRLKIHNSRVSVHPYGMWNSGQAPNIAIELWQVKMVGCEIYNTYVDNTISLINTAFAPTGVQSIRVHHNILDMEKRSGGSGYGLELTVHDAEVDNNFFLKGTYGIANWDKPMWNWNIHHNVFYGLSGNYPGEVVRSQWSGLHNVKLYNNTVEFAGTRTMNFLGVYGGTSENIDIKNNLVINSNTGYSYYHNQLVHKENGAVINNMQITNNLLQNLDLNISGITVLSSTLKNLNIDPKLTKAGSRPDPYYVPMTGSPLLNSGANVGLPYSGTAPDIGAFEVGLTSVPPTTSPTPTAPVASATQLIFDASQALLNGKMTLQSDATAGKYFAIPVGSGVNYTAPMSSFAHYPFQLPKTGTYVIWARIKTPSAGKTTYYIYDGMGRWTTWNTGSCTDWTWVKVSDAYTNNTPVTFAFKQGSNHLLFGWRDENVQVNKVIITDNLSFVPN
jgi:hypothetical protein